MRELLQGFAFQYLRVFLLGYLYKDEKEKALFLQWQKDLFQRDQLVFFLQKYLLYSDNLFLSEEVFFQALQGEQI